MKLEYNIKSICQNNHTFGDGKNVDLQASCPYCSGEVIGVLQKASYTAQMLLEKGYIISVGEDNDQL